MINPYQHYEGNTDIIEYTGLPECETNIKNIGWTLGNDCPYRCIHCYSMSARMKGQNLSKPMIDRVVNQLVINGVETVNLGGNEPLFTNGANPKNTLLPYIIETLTSANIAVGLTTSGITLLHLEKYHPLSFDLLNDIDISLDSPFEKEHNENRGANLYTQAIKSIELCSKYNKEHSIIMCGMRWNFTEKHIHYLVEIAKKFGSNIRINPIKPVEPQHKDITLLPEQYFKGFQLLMTLCTPIDLGEPPIAALTKYKNAAGCPCGRTSFRIHSITPDGKIPISPCVYLHGFKVGDILKDELSDIIQSPQFKIFRMRNKNPHLIKECNGCELITSCKGGCSARSYLYGLHQIDKKSFFNKDPFCPKEYGTKFNFPEIKKLNDSVKLVHIDYLCTWIGKPNIL